MNTPDKAERLSAEPPKPNTDEANPRRGLLALLVYTTVALVASIVLPVLVTASRRVSMRGLWILSQAVFGVSMLGTFLTASSLGTIALFGISGFSWAVSAWIPYALLGAEASSSSPRAQAYELAASAESHADEGKCYDGEDTGEGCLSNDVGLVYGIHNLAICLPQILVTLAMGVERMLAGQTAQDQTGPETNLAWVFRFAGVFSLVAMYVARGIREPN